MKGIGHRRSHVAWFHLHETPKKSHVTEFHLCKTPRISKLRDSCFLRRPGGAEREELLNAYVFPFQMMKCCVTRQRWWLCNIVNNWISLVVKVMICTLYYIKWAVCSMHQNAVFLWNKKVPWELLEDKLLENSTKIIKRMSINLCENTNNTKGKRAEEQPDNLQKNLIWNDQQRNTKLGSTSLWSGKCKSKHTLCLIRHKSNTSENEWWIRYNALLWKYPPNSVQYKDKFQMDL